MADNEKGLSGADAKAAANKGSDLAGGKGSSEQRGGEQDANTVGGDAAKTGNRQSPAAVTGSQQLTDNNLKGSSQKHQPGDFVGPQPLSNSNLGAQKPGDAAKQSDAPISDEEAEEKLHEQLVREFGPDYVRVKKEAKGDQPAMVTTFSKRAWDGLGPNKEGWIPVARVPKEVKEMQKKKEAEANK